MATKGNIKTGTVKAYNVSPKGSYEGLLLENSGEVIQLNFPREWGFAVADLVQPGEKIEAEVEPEDLGRQSSHEVYGLKSISRKGQKTMLSLGDGDAPHEFSGKVAHLNYALHGEVNGGVLQSGDFLHLKPEGAAALKICVGMSVKGTGHRKPMMGGQHVIEADEVNGIRLERKPKPKKKAVHR